MNWKLIFGLSLFGLAMAFSTVYFIPTPIEPFCWLAIFIVCAYLIAKVCSKKYFLHGLMVSIVNSVWITGAHVLLYSKYIATHADEMKMMYNMPLNTHPRILMIITGPVIGLVFGCILGLFAFIASKLVKK
jgi:hypothetical protein